MTVDVARGAGVTLETHGETAKVSPVCSIAEGRACALHRREASNAFRAVLCKTSSAKFLRPDLSILLKETPKEKFKSLKAKLKYSLDLYGDAVKQEGDVIRCPQSTREIVLGRGRVMLAGEAAGLINPSSGDRISFAATNLAG